MRCRRTVFIANLGTPRSADAEAVTAFLREFLGDPLVVDYPKLLWRPLLEHVILRSRPRRVAAMYRSIAGAGPLPLERGTRAIVAGLAEHVGGELEIRAAYRYGAPAVSSELAQALNDPRREVAIVPLFPHRTSSSSETLVEAALRTCREAGGSARTRIVRIDPDDPGYIAALADRISSASDASARGHLVISFHGIPRRYDRREGGRYRADCERTAAALLAALGVERSRATIAFQSRFGPEPWIGPPTFGVLRDLARRGVRDVVVATPGFLTDGLETLEEIGVRARAAFLEAGGRTFTAAPAVEAHPAFVASLARKLRAAFASDGARDTRQNSARHVHAA